MSARLRIGLAAAAAALVFAAYFGLREHKTRQVEVAAAAGRLFDLPPLDQLRRVEIVRRDAEPGGITVVRGDDGGWRLTQPIAGRAAESTLAGVLDPLRDRSSQQAISDVTDLAPFGLAAPTATVRVETVDGRSIRVRVGRETPYGGRLYVQVDDDPTIHVVEGGFQHSLRRSVDDWRARTLLSDFPDPVTRITFRTGEAAWAITATSGAWWGPAGEALHADRVEPLLSRIRHMTVDGFLPVDAVPAAAAALRVEGDGASVELAFGPPPEGQGAVPVRGPDLAGTVSRYIYDSLWSPPSALTAPTEGDDMQTMSELDAHADHGHD
jgi:hypothetical protein